MTSGKYVRTPEIIEKNRLASLGQVAWNKGLHIDNGWTGRKHTKEAKDKMRLAKLGNTWNINKKRPLFSEEWRRNMGRQGEKHHNWKGGVTSLGMRIRTSFEYRQWRSDVFTRDSYTCQECGIRGGYLHAHHIKPFHQILEEYDIKTVEESKVYADLWNINNGQTLCEECHKKTDSYMKRGHNGDE